VQQGLEIGSILIGSRDPERLAAWYTDAFFATPNEHGVYEFGGVAVLFERRDDVSTSNGEPGRHILNFHVPDAGTHAQLLDRMGATWLVPVEERDVGWFGTLLDPDGNYVQIIQFKPEYGETSKE
jgi:predicted enzyme related to lactoylglutathione lyase